ncbi:MAG: carbon starvation protein A [bacterium]
MNALVIGAILAVWLACSYRLYGGFIARRLFSPSDKSATPAITRSDGVDFHAARSPVLFGHHFSSIAGAGPIIGPLLGVLAFGWLPALLWIGLGSVFIGAVHDYTALMASTRTGGRSVGHLAEQRLGRRARATFSLFLWLALILVIAIFGVVTARTFTSQPQIVVPTFGLILLAILFGGTVLRRRLPLLPLTLLALVFLAGLIALGDRYPVDLGETVFGLPTVQFWFWVLMVYCVAASVLPVWLLLQPRDYLSTWILYLGLGAGFVGLVVLHPSVHSPAWIGFHSAEQGPMWPMLFVLIACGAVSGFHSLVASGTTSKQLARETDGQRIGFGAMILEAALAGLVVLIAASVLPWDSAAGGGSLQFLMGEGGGPIVTFATGFSRLVEPLPWLTPAAGLFFGMLMLNAFVITTLDTSTRLGRFIWQELTSDVPWLRHRLVATLITVLCAGWLGATDSYKAIWPVFGATNQLVAALVLIVISSWLVGRGKPRRYTLVPALIMLATSVGALVYQGVGFWRDGKYLLGAVATALLVLTGFIGWEARGLLRSRRD